MIEVLTKEQELGMIPFANKWIERILRTEQTDEEIKQGVKNIYKAAGKEEPVVYIMDSPLGSQLMAKFLQNLTVEQRRELELGEGNIVSNIRNNIWNNIWNNIESNIRNNIDNNIVDNIRNNIRSNIVSNIRNNIVNNIKQGIELFSYNDASWVHWYLYQLYYFEVNLLEEDEYSKLLRNYINDVIDTWMCIYLNGVAIVSRKPIVRREDGRLSSDQKPAVAFMDGYEIYFLDGVELPKDLWSRVVSKEMSLSEIMKIEISDQRTVALKYNPQAIIKEKAKLIHADDRTNELYLVENSDINRLTEFPKMYFVKMTCPTGRVFIEGVPPEIAETTLNATDCQAWLCGLQRSQYDLMKLES